MHTKLLTQIRLLHPLLPMKPRTLPLLSRAFFFPPSKFLRTAPFKARAFSSRAHAHARDKLPVRPSKSLVDDEADLSDWVDDLRTGRVDRFSQRFSSDEDEDRKFRPPPRNNNRASTNLGKRRGEGLRIGRQNANARRKIRPRSDDDEEVVESRRKFKGGGVRAFLGEDESEDEESDGSEEEEILNKSRTALFGQQNGLNRKTVEPTPRPSSPGGSDSYLSESRFDQCSVSQLSLKGVKDAGYEKMTVVQEATLPVILKGKDVLAKARTGTGKTVAFLLPSIEVVVKSPPSDHDHRRPPIFVLVICPTRELASQAAAEANKLLKYHPTIGVQVVIGGTRLALEQKRMQANPCQILVATPGRLRDHIENTAGFSNRLMGVKVLVLDEADHLLDMGFRKDIERIIAAVPKQRQTLMFSATVPEEVRQVCHIALRRDHEFINTVQEGTEETHSQVRQMHLVAPLDKHFPLLYVLLKDHIADDVDYKVLVFCTTAMVTRLVADLLGELNLNVREIHSRKPQSYRTRVSEEFRKSKGLILVTSDVSARGVDYPDVTLVIQVGLPADREQYIHRLGRTGRRGKEGQGILLLAPWEEFFLSTVKDLPIEKAPVVPSVDPDTKRKVEKALSHVDMKNKEAAYQAWLGYYNSNKKVGRDKYRLVELANEFSRSMGLDNPPAIPKLVLGKMGLRNIPGLRAK
ncbi:DEAD-box ATP-dependent RNA helicase 31 [Vigna radiata var. radiata]|uniref:ATP-dependent RNA helicase n=1 Tax=Vigna radiata var. radiata TaxID=3916 RepID=A0A1S3VEN6_VIGRR|nr:DEAD-box ATP-dependent RNA helicase 31 [Vigna radiata var. radiata]